MAAEPVHGRKHRLMVATRGIFLQEGNKKGRKCFGIGH
jgi:hypothetical protein